MQSLSRRDFLRSTAAAAAGAAAAPLFAGVAQAKADELVGLDATAQAALVRGGQATPRELVEAAIRRVERLNPLLNAVVATDYERALKRADGPLPDGPFKGVPFLVKDLDAYAGLPLTFGCRFFKDYVPEQTAPLIQRIEQAGFVVIGKTNTPEFGLMPNTESHLLGPAHNPWQLAYDTGGSSGGAACAVASGMLPLAHATDGGGSIRVPAQACGLFGLKVSRGRHIKTRDEGPAELSVQHCVTRTVRDSRNFLRVTAKTEDEGATLMPPLAGTDKPLPRLKIAFSTTDMYGERAHPDCVAAVESTARLLEALGHELVEDAPSIDGDAFLNHFIIVWSSFGAGVIADATKQLGGPPPQDAFEPWTWQLAKHFTSQPEDALPRAVDYLHGPLTQEMARFHEEYPVWLTPVLGHPTVKTGQLDQTVGFDAMLAELRRYVAYTPIANSTGIPAMTVPLYWNGDGIPVGSHFSASLGAEGLLLALAAELEVARPWAGRWAPHSAMYAV